jgi:transcriptional regulator with XRE-family HTH domain
MNFDLPTARVNAGYSIRSLARELGISEGAIRRLERGEHVHPATALKVAERFGIQVTDLASFAPGNDEAAA